MQFRTSSHSHRKHHLAAAVALALGIAAGSAWAADSSELDGDRALTDGDPIYAQQSVSGMGEQPGGFSEAVYICRPGAAIKYRLTPKDGAAGFDTTTLRLPVGYRIAQPGQLCHR